MNRLFVPQLDMPNMFNQCINEVNDTQQMSLLAISQLWLRHKAVVSSDTSNLIVFVLTHAQKVVND